MAAAMGRPASKLIRIRLKPKAESLVRHGHPWVFASSVKEQSRDGTAGELVVVHDRRERMVALGLLDPDSPIRVRIVHRGKPAAIDREWWRAQAIRARERRELPADTDGHRWINGDSEGFPGLVADRYAGTLVVKLYSSIWLPRWDEVEAVLREVFAPRHLVLRMSRNLVARAREAGLEEGFRGDARDEVVVFRENGIRFEAAVRHGQKTGFFLDQRDNRARVEALAAGREVLNVFSFSGGFSLYAARGGASRVVDLDISAHALEAAGRNYQLNADEPRIARVAREQVKADAFEWLEACDRRFDLVVVDPPSLAQRERDREGALGAYRKLNAAAIRLLRPGGILVAASCSAHVRGDEFLGLVRGLARHGGRPCEERWTSGHAPDHPAGFPEAEYLKAICLEFG